MPKFTITTDEGKGSEPIQNRLSFASEKAATDDAQNALSDMARDKLPDGSHADFHVKVADDAGNEVYHASLTFDAQTAEEKRIDDEERNTADQKAADEVADAIGALGTRPRR